MKIAGIFEPGGLLASSLEDYEERPEQKKMAAAVASAIESGKHLIVEAGTGTGKTLAYLVPAVLSGNRRLYPPAREICRSRFFSRIFRF
jgi:ATP-dependent DNA helicase DinG